MKIGKPPTGGEEHITRRARFVAIAAPKPYEGVGRALASAYSAVDQVDLPDEMTRLLDRIDRACMRAKNVPGQH
ncbi:MAG: hypothetical protein EP321_12355 [Sphingomonadales bacterium]|nr:MAG: hypothetical protein EP345_14125 [Sphingomonadales bacterium]TNF02880.1 MAG: hypothetical protein EP321_12355 [Sphingomonadales bacterium]